MEHDAFGVIERLVKTVDELEETILKSSEALALKFGEEHSTTARVRGYKKTVDNQRSHIEKLQVAIQDNDFNQVSRLVKIINGLSQLIRDDAKALHESVYSPETSCDIDKNLLN